VKTSTDPLFFNSILKLIDKAVKADLELKRMPDEFVADSYEGKKMKEKISQLESEILQAQEGLKEKLMS
jgi:hypothetical protein